METPDIEKRWRFSLDTPCVKLGDFQNLRFLTEIPRVFHPIISRFMDIHLGDS